MSKAATASTLTTKAPTIRIGSGQGTPLGRDAQDALLRTVIDTHLHLPGTFEMTFHDARGTLLSKNGISVGTQVRMTGHAVGADTDQLLIEGEVTSLEAVCRNLTSHVVVRGYDRCHRLQRARRTRTFLNSSDSDIASQLADAAGLTQSSIERGDPVHDFVGQCNQTDWEFLSQRAREIGYEVGISQGVFYFRKASSVATAKGAPVELTFRKDLRRFLSRVTAGNLAQSVEVRVWDPLQAKVIVHDQDMNTGTARPGRNSPKSMTSTFSSDAPSAATSQPGAPAVGNLGPAPKTTAYVVHDRPVASGPAIDSVAPVVAAGLADQVASAFAEAEGEADGNPGIQPGVVIKVCGVPEAFAGSWLITNARHVFDLSEGGYATEFTVSGRQQRSLLALACAGRVQSQATTIPGVCCGVVTNINDNASKGRVKVALPWLSPDYETDWAPVVQFGAGKRSGALFLPEVGDEVLVGFEFGDPRRPYVIGGILNNGTSYSLGGSPVKETGQTAAVALRGFVSAAGNRLVFADELPPGDGTGPPSTSSITLGTGDGKLSLAIDQVAGTVTLSCSPSPPESKAAAGTISIQCGSAGTINVTAGSGGTVNVDGGANLNLKAQASISIQSQGSISIQGSGQVAIKGAQIALN
jgi:phage protein D